jgi:hypothetical protein
MIDEREPPGEASRSDRASGEVRQQQRQLRTSAQATEMDI